MMKRYRYTGKERDEESGFYYHGARYYAPWLGRWLATDPLESKYAGLSPYNYGFNNPVKWTDSTGMEPDENNNKGGARLETKQPTSGQWEQHNDKGYTGKAAPPFQLSEITVGSTQSHGKGNPLSVGMERTQALSMRIPKAEQEVLMADIYGNGHMGVKSIVSAQVHHIELEHAFRVADNVRGGVGGALGYVVAGELGAEIGAMADNMAQGLFFQRVEPVVGARFSGIPRTKEVPKTEVPVGETRGAAPKAAEPVYKTFSLSSQLKGAAELAGGWQGKGAYIGVDNWRNIILTEGKYVVGGLPGQSNYYTTLSGLKRSGLNRTTLFEGLQVQKHYQLGYREQIGIYRVSGNTPAAFGTTYANPQFGAGGLPQIFIPDYSGLQLIKIIRLK